MNIAPKGTTRVSPYKMGQILISDAISLSIMRMKNRTGLSLGEVPGEVVYSFISFLDLISSVVIWLSLFSPCNWSF